MIPIRRHHRLAGNRSSAATASGRKGIEFWRQRWLHEDDLINHRLTWLLVAQTILFAGCATLLDLLFDTSKALKCHDRAMVLHIVQYVFPWVGFGIALSIGVGVAGALTSMVIIYRKANRELLGSFEYGVHWLPSVMGQISGAFLPLLFAGVWLYLADVLRGLV